MLAAAATGLAPMQAQAPAPTGFVLGRVVDADTGRGIPGVFVAIQPRTPPASPPTTPLPRALTDGQGRFLLRGLAPGSYVLRATVGGNGFSPSGFLVTGLGHQIGSYLNGAYGQRRPEGPEGFVELTATAPHVADAVIRLWKGAAVEGSVVDEAGEPIVAAYVAAVARGDDGRLLTGPSTRTDDRGWFRIGTLKPGEYVIVVPHTSFFLPSSSLAELARGQAGVAAASISRSGVNAPTASGVSIGSSVAAQATLPGVAASSTRLLPATPVSGRTLAYQTTFYPSATSLARASAVRLNAGETRSGLVIRLEPAPATKISGQLVDPAGPVPHFGVRLMSAGAGDGTEAIEAATTVTDASGVFEFPAVPAGSYTLRAVREPGGNPGAAEAPVGRLAERIGAFALEPITVGDSPLSGVTLTLRPGVRVTGQVEFVSTAPAPAPPRALSMVLTPSPPAVRTQAPLTTGSVSSDGRIEFQSAPAGRYLLTANAPANWSVSAVVVDGRDVTDRPVALTRDVDTLIVRLTDRPASIAGTVRVPQGLRLDEVSLFLFPTDRERWADARFSTRVFRTARVQPSGAFEFRPVVPGSYVVTAARDTLGVDWPSQRLLPRLAAAGVSVDVAPGQPAMVSVVAVDLP
jgi:hypothetical protein